MSKIQKLLIVANSGRMMAQMVNNIGLKPLVIDCFGDCDTHTAALESIKVKTLAVRFLKTAISRLNTQYNISHVIYGSGFERHKQSLAYLQQNFIMLGNSFEVFSIIQNKIFFYSRCDALKIPYPQTSNYPPDFDEDWLIKPKRGEGGLGISKYTHQSVVDHSLHYWQKTIAGKPLSVLFITDGVKFSIIGFQQQLNTTLGDNTCIFSGLIYQPKINSNIVQTVSLWLQKLVADFSLKGLNSLDFMLENDCCYALEVNPRPSASMQLYDHSLLLAHIQSCSGEVWNEEIAVVDGYNAYQIVFAETDILISQTIQWPEWVMDIPQAACFIHTGQPICSIIAGGENEQQVKDELLLKQQTINQLLQ